MSKISETPLTILKKWGAIIADYGNAFPENVGVAQQFVETTYPSPYRNAIKETCDVYLETVLKFAPVAPARTALTHFIQWHLDRLTEIKGDKEDDPTENYPIEEAFRQINKDALNDLTDSQKRELVAWLTQAIAATDWSNPQFAPSTLAAQMRAFRLALKWLLQTKPDKSQPSIILSRETIREGLDLVAVKMQQFYTYHHLSPEEKKITEKPYLYHEGNKIHYTLGTHYFRLIDLIDGVTTLGIGQHTGTPRVVEPSAKPRDELDHQIINTRHHDLTKEISYSYSETERESDVFLSERSPKKTFLETASETELTNAVTRLSRGDDDTPLKSINALRQYLNASEPCIYHAIKTLRQQAARGNLQHPTHNHMMTFCQLFSFWQSIRHIDTTDPEFELLAQELLVLMTTHLSPKRCIWTGPSKRITRSAVEFNEDGTAAYLFNPRCDSDSTERVILNLNPGLNSALWAAVREASYPRPFSNFNQRYYRAKKALEKRNIYLPRQASQWGHCALEVLRPVLSDYECDIVRGWPSFANGVTHYYVASDLFIVNQRYKEAINRFLAQLKPDICKQLPLTLTDVQPTLAQPQGEFGSQVFPLRAKVVSLIGALNTSFAQLDKGVGQQVRKGKDIAPHLIKLLNLMAINRAFITSLATSGRWHPLRGVVVRMASGLRVEDKDSKHYNEPRCTCVSSAADGLLALWDQQVASIDDLLHTIDSFPTHLKVDWHSYQTYAQSPAYHFSLSRADLSIVCKPMGEAELSETLRLLGITHEPFALNMLRHVFATTAATRLARPVQNEQLGHELAGQDLLSKQSSAQYSAMTSATQLLDSRAHLLNLALMQSTLKHTRLKHVS